GGGVAARAVRRHRSHRVPGPPRRDAADLMRLLRLSLLLAGAALFVWLVVSIGPGAVVQAFRDLSWRLLVILVFPFGITTLLDTLGWRDAFRRDAVPFPHLLSRRLAGAPVYPTPPTASGGRGPGTPAPVS